MTDPRETPGHTPDSVPLPVPGQDVPGDGLPVPEDRDLPPDPTVPHPRREEGGDLPGPLEGDDVSLPV